MPSPFPGMDPYLEDPDLWPDVHAGLITELQGELNRLLRPKYVARIEQRVFVSDGPDTDLIIRDVRMVAGPRHAAGRRSERPTATATATATAAAATIEPVDVTTDPDDPELVEVRQRFLRIADVRDRSVVTVIELLSPSNKRRGSPGRRSYLDKWAEVTSSPANWAEIDLLRAGTRMSVRGQLPAHDYRVHVSRAGRDAGERRRDRAWPIPLAHPLPPIPIPLRDGDADVTVDLQGVLDRAYERGAYDVDVDYAADPVPPLLPEQAAWARAAVAVWRDRPPATV